MVNSEKQQPRNDRKIDDVEDGIEQSSAGDCSEYSTLMADASSSVLRTSSTATASIASDSAVTEFHRENEDSLLQQSERVENLVQWLRALDMQVMGACRADERLKPLLKINAFTGAAEDRLLSQLSQHFEPSEVGMLARCLCVPLVSIRVGKINKLGNVLCPTPTRGNLNLILLPTSDLRISFTGDDGSTERLVTLTCDTQCSAVEIEEIFADKSGRSFLIKIADDEIFYFWCSEKSKLLGNELLRKMKDLLKRKPCLSELTGISESCLESFAIHLRAYLVGSTMTNAHASSIFPVTSSLETSIEFSEFGLNLQSSAGYKTSRSRLSGGQGAKTNPLYQGILSPRTSSFKEGVARNVSSLRSVSRERFRRRGDSYISCIDNVAVPPPSSPNASSSNCSNDKFQEATGSPLCPPSNLLESLGTSVVGDLPLGSAAQVPLMDSSLFSPYYCWCPPVASTLQYTPGSAQHSTPLSESLSLHTNLLSVSKSSSLLTSKLPLNLNEVPLDFPPLLPEPLVMLPLSIPASQQIPTFTPLVCDPIVHIPLIDVYSSGQGYLVSAGPAISTAISPMHPNLAGPLIPETDSLVEKSARETLRMLINSSSQPNPPLIDVLPSVLASGSEMQNILAAGSRGLYSGTRDVDAVASSMAVMGLVSTSDRFVLKGCISREKLSDEMDKSDCAASGSCLEDGLPKSEERI